MSKYKVFHVASLKLLDELEQSGTRSKSYFYETVRFKYFPEKVHTFVKNHKCIACGVEATEVRIEKLYGCTEHMFGNPHLNVYAVCGMYEVMMTVDHDVLASKGGEDLSSNYNTMCARCNHLRGNKTNSVQEFLERMKGRDLLMEHMGNFFNPEKPKPKKTPEQIAHQKAQEEFWNSDHLWHYREYLRYQKREEKRKKYEARLLSEM